ncbi:MAG: helix-turn-helix domain-containing protein [Bacilli bacterium]
MKGLRLTMREKYKVIAKVYRGKLSVKRATIILKLSARRIDDLLRIYEEEGLSGFSHKSKNRSPVNKAPLEPSTLLFLYMKINITVLTLLILKKN